MRIQRRTFIKRIGLGAAGLGMVSAFPSCVTSHGLNHGHLPRSTPEEQGVSSGAILGFLNAIAESKHEFHSAMMVRRGHVIAEGWWTPYRATANHMLYSLSKSFTSTAVGFAVTEGMLNVEDHVISFFPGDVPAEKKSDPHLRALKVKHLLTMSVGRSKDSMPIIAKEDHWVRAFLAAPIEREPGSVFLYDSGATYMLSAIVQKVTGQKVIDYLRPRLFDPLEIRGMTWEVSPQGINTGGWGLSVRTEALAKFGQLYLQNGTWHGEQIIPARWVHEATTFKIQQPAGKGQSLEKLKTTSDWHQGYCYQFWRCRHDAFRGDGAYGQFMIVMPGLETVVAITCQTTDMQGELNLVWDHLLPGIKDVALPADPQARGKLVNKLNGLALLPPPGRFESSTGAKVSGKTFQIESNELGFQSAVFEMGANGCVFKLKDAQEEYVIDCGFGKWIDGTCNVPGTPPVLTVGNVRPCKIAVAGAWKNENTFVMVWRYYETPHHDTVTCRFQGDTVKIEFANATPGHKETRPILNGRI
jgi:CubicO group peptidase (beta-lactamase class C family)